jgi:hypothetical protein
MGQEPEDSLPRHCRRRSLVADTVHKHRPLSGSCRTARGLSLFDVADPQEKSRVYSGSSDDHEAMASLCRCLAHTKCTVNGPILQFIILGEDIEYE